jgi:CRP-like cAMP-binding protein
MEETGGGGSLRDRLARQGEDAIGKLAQDLLENPLVSGAIARAFEARERAVQAQEAALGALNIPSAADVERLTRRLRSVSQRLEGIEDGVDRLDARLEQLAEAVPTPPGEQLAAIEAQLTKLAVEVANLANALDHRPAPVPREQQRLEVEPAVPPARAPRRRTKR